MTRNSGADPAALEQEIGYTFQNRDLLLTALTHSSYYNENKNGLPCNERLEFLGDAVLSAISAEFLYRRESGDEGELSRTRSALVSEEALCRYAREINLGKYLRLGKGESETGRSRPSTLADAFEAVIAAVYLDGGFEKAQGFVLPFVTKAAKALMQSGSTEDYKTLLQKFIQHNRGDILEYVVTNESGPSHKRTFEVQVSLNNNVIGSGFGSSKREAEQMAVKEALRLFGEVGVDA